MHASMPLLFFSVYSFTAFWLIVVSKAAGASPDAVSPAPVSVVVHDDMAATAMLMPAMNDIVPFILLGVKY